MAFFRIVSFVAIVCASSVDGFFDTLFAGVQMKETIDFCPAAGNYEGFSWENCNTIPVPVVFEDFNISTHPIVLGRGFCFNATTNLKSNVGENNNPIESYISLKMKVDGEYTELCDLDPKACYEEDVCKFLVEKQNRCPSNLKEDLHNCTCPFPQRVYNVKNYVAGIPQPPFGISGSFKVTIVVRESGRDIACVVVYFCVNHC